MMQSPLAVDLMLRTKLFKSFKNRTSGFIANLGKHCKLSIFMSRDSCFEEILQKSIFPILVANEITG